MAWPPGSGTLAHALRRLTSPNWNDSDVVHNYLPVRRRPLRPGASKWKGNHILGQGGDGAAILWLRVDAQTNVIQEQRVEKLVCLGTASWKNSDYWAQTGGARPDTGLTDGSVIKEVHSMQILSGSTVFPQIRGFKKAKRRDIMHIWMDYSTRGDLLEVLHHYQNGNHPLRMPEAFVWYVFEQLAQACVELETRTRARPGARVQNDEVIIHQDIKPNNIFVSEPRAGGQFPNYPSVRLGDFGRSEITYPTDPHWQHNFRRELHTGGWAPVELWTRNDENYIMGVYNYPPGTTTARNNVRVQSATNIYQVGMVILCLMRSRRRLPQLRFFNAAAGGPTQTHVANQPRLQNFFSVQLRTLVTNCITDDPANRPTAQAVLNTVRAHINANIGVAPGWPPQQTFAQQNVHTQAASWAIGMNGAGMPDWHGPT